jgi:hypothetical protein
LKSETAIHAQDAASPFDDEMLLPVLKGGLNETKVVSLGMLLALLLPVAMDLLSSIRGRSVL